jgi:hypothetical protein
MSFTRLENSDFLVGVDSITATCWSNNTPTLTKFYTSSTQEAGSSGNYYLSVYQTASSLSSAEKQFDIVYGNKVGSGSVNYNDLVPGVSYTKTMYGQYRNLVLGDENSDFNFGGTTVTDIYVLSISRTLYKESLFPGSLNLTLYSGSGAGKRTINITDNSNDVTTITYTDAGRVFNLVSGSNGSAITTSPFSGVIAGYTPSGSYGWFLPDIGTIILNPAALDLPYASGGINLATSRSSDSSGNNNSRIFQRIASGSDVSGSFSLNSQETITSDYIYVRVKNAEFNYSENPSFISGSTGELVFSDFINNPKTYVTTVGLYNDNNELLAVAKMSRPLKKDFTKEALVRIKLDF